MNFGIILLALFLVGASIFGIFAIAQANQDPYTDTFNVNQTTNTTATRGIIQNTTAPLIGAGGGLAIIFAVFIIFVAVVFVIKAAFGHSSYNTGRR